MAGRGGAWNPRAMAARTNGGTDRMVRLAPIFYVGGAVLALLLVGWLVMKMAWSGGASFRLLKLVGGVAIGVLAVAIGALSLRVWRSDHDR
jgi:hypothetical protein